MAETSLHLATQASRVFLVHTWKPLPVYRPQTHCVRKRIVWAACLRQISGMNYTARYCKHIGVADAYRAILGTDEIHCLRSLILETIVERMCRRSWQLVQQTVALVCQPYVYQYLA